MDSQSSKDEIILSMAVKSIIHEQDKNGGRVPRGLIPKVIQDLNVLGVNVTRDVLNGRVRRSIAKQKNHPNVMATADQPMSDDCARAKQSASDRRTDYCHAIIEQQASHGNDLASRGLMTTNLDTSEFSRGISEGNTNDDAGLWTMKNRLVHEVFLAYADVKLNSRLPNETLMNLVKEKRRELNIPDDVKISLKFIRSRLFAKCLISLHPGTLPPLRELEMIALPQVIARAKMGQPMRPSEVASLVNNLLEGTSHQQKLIAWKKIHIPHQVGEKLGKVGMGYATRFMKRHARHMDVQVDRKFSSGHRPEWLKPDHLNNMYTEIYNGFVEARVARMVEEPIAYDIHGAQVDVGSPAQYGLPSNIIMENQDYILFGEETAVYTCEHRLTILPLMAATGEPVLCVVVFDGEYTGFLEAIWHTGIDITVDPILDDDGDVDLTNINNYGPGKYLPSGPVCHFRGIKIPALTFKSPSAAITGEMFAMIIAALDSLNLYPRENSATDVSHPEPCVVVDGHEGCLDPSVQQLIKKKGHKWNFALGVPNLTHLWQVGNAPGQSDCFQTCLTRATEELMRFKDERGMTLELGHCEIMPLVNVAWNNSFAQVDRNRRALATRGWYPPTKKILDIPTLSDLQDHHVVVQQPTKNTSDNDTLQESLIFTNDKSAHGVDVARKEETTGRLESLMEGDRRHN